MKTEAALEGWECKNLGNFISENKKSGIQVQDATDFEEYLFFTSGEKILRYKDWLIDGENIFMSTGGVANVQYYNGKCAYSTDTYCFKGKMNTKFFYYYLLNIISKINYSYFQGTGLKHLQKPMLKSHEFLFPEKSKEQEKIAEILTTVDNAIDKTRELIEKNEMIKDGLIGELIEKNNDLSNPLGEVLLKIKRGPSLPTNSERKGVIYLTSDNISEDNLLQWELTKYLDLPFNKNCVIDEGDVLINCVNSNDRVGKTAYYNLNTENIIVGFNNFALTFTKEVYSKYMYYLLSGPKFQKEMRKRIKPAVNQVSFSGSDLQIIKVGFPDYSEQKKIVQRLDVIEIKIKLKKDYLNKLIKIKKGLMQDLLTCKVRVKI